MEHLFDCERASDNSSLSKLPFAEFEVSSYFIRIETFQPPCYFRNPQIAQQPMLQHNSVSLDISHVSYTLPWHLFLKNAGLDKIAVSAVCVLECQVDEDHKWGQAQMMSLMQAPDFPGFVAITMLLVFLFFTYSASD